MTARRISKLLLSAVSTACILSVHGLDPATDYYQYEFVLSPKDAHFPSEIVDVQQDRTGFLWLATAEGLARYDGLELTRFRVSRHPELLSNSPRQLFVDSTNRLLIATERGLSAYEQGSFRTIATGLKSAVHFRAMTEDANGTVWLGSDEGLWRLNDGHLTPVSFGQPLEHIRSLLWHGDRLYVGAKGRIHIITENESVEIVLPEKFAKSRVRDLAFYQERLWGATRAGMFHLEANTVHAFEHPELKHPSVDFLLADRDENLWFGNRRRLGRFRPNGELELPNMKDEQFGFDPDITEIFEDAQGQHWQTSERFGLIMLRDTNIRRLSYAEGLSSPNVTALVTDGNNTTYVATNKGLSSLSGEIITNYTDGDFTGPDTIKSMFLNQPDQLWVVPNPHCGSTIWRTKTG